MIAEALVLSDSGASLSFLAPTYGWRNHPTQMIASFSRNKTEILIALLFARQNEGPISEGKPFKYIICGSPSTLQCPWAM